MDRPRIIAPVSVLIVQTRRGVASVNSRLGVSENTQPPINASFAHPNLDPDRCRFIINDGWAAPQFLRALASMARSVNLSNWSDLSRLVDFGCQLLVTRVVDVPGHGAMNSGRDLENWRPGSRPDSVSPACGAKGGRAQANDEVVYGREIA